MESDKKNARVAGTVRVGVRIKKELEDHPEMWRKSRDDEGPPLRAGGLEAKVSHMMYRNGVQSRRVSQHYKLAGIVGTRPADRVR